MSKSLLITVIFIFSTSIFAQQKIEKKGASAVKSPLLGKRVELKKLGLSFQPPANWKQTKDKYEWKSTIKGDKASNLNIKQTPGSGQYDSLIKNKDSFINILKKEYSKIKQGKFELLDNKIETYSGKKVIVTYGQAELSGLKMKNIQAFFETPKNIYIFTYTTLDKDWNRNLPIIKASLNSIKFQ